MIERHLYKLQNKIHALNRPFARCLNKYYQEMLCETLLENGKKI